MTAPAEGKKAWATLLTRTDYLAGALVMADSIKKTGSKYPFVVFATAELPEEARAVLRTAGIAIKDIDYLQPDEENQVEIAANDHRFADTWTKLRVFELTEYERVVLVDSDMLCLGNMDELMTLDLPKGWVAAAHACTCNPRKLAHYPADWVPANCAHTHAKLTIPLSPQEFTKPTHHSLNSGLVVLQPDPATFHAIVAMVRKDPIVQSFKFPDQDLLAHFFKGRYLPLSYRYNALKTLKDCHPTMWRDQDVKNVHYILADKPWIKRPEEGDDFREMHQWWWDAYDALSKEWEGKEGWEVVDGAVRGMVARAKAKVDAAKVAA